MTGHKFWPAVRWCLRRAHCTTLPCECQACELNISSILHNSHDRIPEPSAQWDYGCCGCWLSHYMALNRVWARSRLWTHLTCGCKCFAIRANKSSTSSPRRSRVLMGLWSFHSKYKGCVRNRPLLTIQCILKRLCLYSGVQILGEQQSCAGSVQSTRWIKKKKNASSWQLCTSKVTNPARHPIMPHAHTDPGTISIVWGMIERTKYATYGQKCIYICKLMHYIVHIQLHFH